MIATRLYDAIGANCRARQLDPDFLDFSALKRLYPKIGMRIQPLPEDEAQFTVCGCPYVSYITIR